MSINSLTLREIRNDFDEMRKDSLSSALVLLKGRLKHLSLEEIDAVLNVEFKSLDDVTESMRFFSFKNIMLICGVFLCLFMYFKVFIHSVFLLVMLPCIIIPAMIEYSSAFKEKRSIEAFILGIQSEKPYFREINKLRVEQEAKMVSDPSAGPEKKISDLF